MDFWGRLYITSLKHTLTRTLKTLIHYLITLTTPIQESIHSSTPPAHEPVSLHSNHDIHNNNTKQQQTIRHDGQSSLFCLLNKCLITSVGPFNVLSCLKCYLYLCFKLVSHFNIYVCIHCIYFPVWKWTKLVRKLTFKYINQPRRWYTPSALSYVSLKELPSPLLVKCEYLIGIARKLYPIAGGDLLSQLKCRSRVDMDRHHKMPSISIFFRFDILILTSVFGICT